MNARKKTDTHCFAPGCKSGYPDNKGSRNTKDRPGLAPIPAVLQVTDNLSISKRQSLATTGQALPPVVATVQFLVLADVGPVLAYMLCYLRFD
ncbi:hypothetical protein HPB47_020129 [Ixodes persulcatus]|uniref:Uncharacterized protein n=1 Tax=Ixodes persulcatus TaxID=34615 RepID=A0AC60QG74_IXOPE|nr:hypothetical protein HPB47_020129 [Ixodes persulcatus]